MSVKNKLYSVKEVCDQYKITRKTLFYYDRIGLLKPAKRQGKQAFKYYNDQSLSRLETIIQYRNAGLTIDEIRVIIDEKDKEIILPVLEKVKNRLIEEEFEKQEEIRRLEILINSYS